MPAQQQQHHGIEQQQQLHTRGRQQNDGQAQDIDNISMEDGTITTLEDRIKSTVRRILLEVIQVVISTQKRHDSSSPSMDCERTTITNCNTNTEQTRPTCRLLETHEHVSEFIIQAQGLPAQGPVNYQGTPTTLGAQQTDFASLSVG